VQFYTEWSKVSVHMMVTTQKVTNNVQSVPRQTPDIWWHDELCSQIPCSVLYGPYSEYILFKLLYFCLFSFLFYSSGAQKIFDHPVYSIDCESQINSSWKILATATKMNENFFLNYLGNFVGRGVNRQTELKSRDLFFYVLQKKQCFLWRLNEVNRRVYLFFNLG